MDEPQWDPKSFEIHPSRRSQSDRTVRARSSARAVRSESDLRRALPHSPSLRRSQGNATSVGPGVPFLGACKVSLALVRGPLSARVAFGGRRKLLERNVAPAGRKPPHVDLVGLREPRRGRGKRGAGLRTLAVAEGKSGASVARPPLAAATSGE